MNKKKHHELSKICIISCHGVLSNHNTPAVSFVAFIVMKFVHKKTGEELELVGLNYKEIIRKAYDHFFPTAKTVDNQKGGGA